MCKIRKFGFLFSLIIVAFILHFVCLSTEKVFPVAAGGTGLLAENVNVYTDGNTSYTFTYAEGWSLTAVAGAEGKLTLPTSDKCNEGTALPAAQTYTIGEKVFAGTKVREVIIPNAVTAVGAGAFDDCLLLSSVTFEEGGNALTVLDNAFNDCDSLTFLEFPARLTTLGDNVFSGCGSLKWLYINSAVQATRILPAESEATVVFHTKEAYESAIETLVPKEKATYLVKIEFYVGNGAPTVTERLYGRNFSWVRNTNSDSKEYNIWQERAVVKDLPAQDESYVSTVWYRDESFKTKATLSYVDGLLLSDEGAPALISLYAHATVLPPELSRTFTTVYGKGGFNLENAEETAEAFGIVGNGAAFVFSAFTENGQSVTHMNDVGTYLVTVTLDESYGVWKSQPMTSVSIIRDDSRTMQIMLVLLSIVGLVAVVLSISLVLVRNKLSKKKRRREMTADEIIDRFIAEGGRTHLKK